MEQASLTQAGQVSRAGGSGTAASERERDRRFGVGLLRAVGGALIFSFPMLMTMEMWWLGFYLDNLRLALFVFLAIPMLIGLSYYAGFQDTFRGIDDILDAFAAFAVGFATSAVLLLLFAIIGPGMSADEIVGKIAVQAVLASIGALLAQNQLGQDSGDEKRKRRAARYPGQLFLMAVGAVFLSSSLASTEEMVLIAYKMTAWHVVALAVSTLVVMHGFVQVGVFGPRPALPPSFTPRTVFLRFTVVGYVIALLVSAYTLWIFGRAEGTGLAEFFTATIVLGFPAGLGAAISRLLF